MRPIARLLLIALLRHHREATKRNPPRATGRLVESLYTVAYSDLCVRAGVPHVQRIVGQFLGEIAQWSRDNGFPPLNSLAVNAATGLPGEGYDGAGGFLIADWPEEVAQVIRFAGYPINVP